MTPNLTPFKTPQRLLKLALATNLGVAAVFALPSYVAAEAQTAAPAANRFLGTITAVGSGYLTVKTDSGAERKVTVPDGIKLQRIAPGEKDLSKAAIIQFSALAVGDRVLVRLAPDPATDPVTAIGIIAIPQADLAQKQEKDREEWQHNGVGGLVKSVDPGTGNIVITSGAGATQKTITLHTTPTTELRRYAADSVNFDAAKPAPLEVIKPGDQIRAKGTKSDDGNEIAAVAVVSGSFRNISGTIASINASTMTVTLKDLTTKQMVNIHIGPDAQMRKLPENTARMLANSGKPSGEGNSAAGATPGAATPSPAASSPATAGSSPTAANGNPDAHRPATAPGGNQPTAAGDSATAGAAGEGGRSGRHTGGGDPQQMIARAPAIHLSDLQKGDAIMLVSTQGTTDVTAITLLAGVEPLLQAPASTQNQLLSNWNMSSGGAEAAQ